MTDKALKLANIGHQTKNILLSIRHYFHRFQSFLNEHNKIPDHEKVEAHKQPEDASKVGDQRLDGVGLLLLLNVDCRAFKKYLDVCFVIVRHWNRASKLE